MIISLIGFMGCGKSSVGKELKRLLSCDMVDLDDYVEAMSGRTISEIFETEGEAAFRKLELQALNEIFECYPQNRSEKPSFPLFREESYPQIVDNSEKDGIGLILCLGGGTLTQPAAAELVRAHCRCIYLRAGVEELTADLEGRTAQRPLLKDISDAASPEAVREALHQRISQMLDARQAIYEKSADIIVDVDGLLSHEIAEKILEKF